jgi:hypothetical protein
MRSFSVKADFFKKCQSKSVLALFQPLYINKGVPKILKICQEAKFDIGFQKNNMRSRFGKIDFVESDRFSQTVPLKMSHF